MGVWKNYLEFLGFVALAFFGLYLFAVGFLLNRTIVAEKSKCDEKSCFDKKFQKLIIILVDALRYDFVNWQEGQAPFWNQLNFTNQLLNEKPENARLFRFVSDPPTTTLQRLKGLTTGSLPTFIDAGSNFGGSEIDEDNWISQFINGYDGRNSVFMGDDTWIDLFPKSFAKTFPFPSFDVHDLHTVDDGILQHLESEMKSDHWSLLIAHFLGVDHCGHRYGPDHEQMTKKLRQMDEVIK